MVFGLTCSRDGRLLISGSWDGTVRAWDANISVEEWHGPEARELVQALLAKHHFREAVLAEIASEKRIIAEVRARALRLAEKWEESPHDFDDASWKVVKEPGRKPEEYELALRWSQDACRLVPGNGEYLFALGLAQYRTGRYEPALASLREAAKINAQRATGTSPGHFACQAMVLYQLGQLTEARAMLEVGRQRMKGRLQTNEEESRSFLREAETLIEKR
jgi:tetratricopeptide (TPR) repeat protein